MSNEKLAMERAADAQQRAFECIQQSVCMPPSIDDFESPIVSSLTRIESKLDDLLEAIKNLYGVVNGVINDT